MVEIVSDAKPSRVLDSVNLAKNIDRVIHLRDDVFLAASYNLTKETGVKTGSLTTFRFDSDNRK